MVFPLCAIAVATLAGADLGRAIIDRGVPAAEVVVPFASDPAIGTLARDAVAGAKDDTARAYRLYDAILALKRDGTIVGDRDNSPKARLPRTAAELLTPGSDRAAGCYELSALYVAAARSAGLDAVGVERDQSIGTGQIGHIMAGVRLGERLTIFDLQNESKGTLSRVRELGDLEMAAHHYNHLAVARYLRAEHDAALRAIDWALRLAPESPSFLNNRATVLASVGEPVLALAEVAHAVELAPDVPLYRYQLGRLYLVTGAIDAAIQTLHQALELRPRYGLARRDLGWAYLLAGRVRAAEAELDKARRARDTPEADLYLALLFAARGDDNRALSVVEVALEGGPDPALEALRVILTGAAGGDAATVARLRRVLASVGAARKRAAGALPTP